MSEYKDYSLKDLKELAKELKLTGIHKLDKIRLIQKIEEIQGIKPNVNKDSSDEIITSTSKEIDDDLEKKIDELLTEEENNSTKENNITSEIEEIKNIEPTLVEKENIVNKEIDLSSEEAITDTNLLFKELSNIKAPEEKQSDIILSVPTEVKEDVKIVESEIKPAYQGSMLVGIILSKIPSATYFEVLKENNLNEDELKNLISIELQAGEPYNEEKKNLFVNDFVNDFVNEIARLVKIKTIKKVDLTLQHKKWADYLNIYKLTPEDLLKRYPNHKQKEILEDLIRHNQQIKK